MFHDTGNGVGAVLRYRTGLDDFNALDHVEGNGIEIHEGIRAVRWESVRRDTLTVHQDQGVFLAQPAQRNARTAGGAIGKIIGPTAGGIDGRITQVVRHRYRTTGLDVLVGGDLNLVEGDLIGGSDQRSRSLRWAEVPSLRQRHRPPFLGRRRSTGSPSIRSPWTGLQSTVSRSRRPYSNPRLQ